MLRFFDSSHSFSANQKHTKIQILTQATPTIENGFNLLSINIPEKSVSFYLNSLIHSVNLATLKVSELQMSFVTCTQT